MRSLTLANNAYKIPESVRQCHSLHKISSDYSVFYEERKDLQFIDGFNAENSIIIEGLYEGLVKPRITDNFFADNNVKKLKKIKKNYYDSIVIAVPHKKFLDLGIKNIKKFAKKNNVIYDVKSIFSSKFSDLQL